MFTGIVDHTATIVSCIPENEGLRLQIASRFTDLIPGESISVDGACLTVVSAKDSVFDVQLSQETLRLTVAKHYFSGARVHLERAMRAMDRFGGHYVTGHVDTCCEVSARDEVGDCLQLSITGVQAEQQNYLIPKGSITVLGVSLTLNSIFSRGFSVMLIPHTLDITRLGSLSVGDKVNIEFDWMVKVLVNQIQQLGVLS